MIKYSGKCLLNTEVVTKETADGRVYWDEKNGVELVDGDMVITKIGKVVTVEVIVDGEPVDYAE